MRLKTSCYNRPYTIRYSDKFQNFVMVFESLERAKSHADELKRPVYFEGRKIVYEPQNKEDKKCSCL